MTGAFAMHLVTEAIREIVDPRTVEIRIDDEIGHAYVDAEDPLDILARPLPEYSGSTNTIEAIYTHGKGSIDIAIVVPLTDCKRRWFRRRQFLEVSFNLKASASALESLAKALASIADEQKSD